MGDNSGIEWTDSTWSPVTGWVGKHAAGRVLDGRTWDEYPAGPAA